MVTTGEQLPYQGQILVSNSPVRYSPVRYSPVSNSPVSNSPYPICAHTVHSCLLIILTQIVVTSARCKRWCYHPRLSIGLSLKPFLYSEQDLNHLPGLFTHIWLADTSKSTQPCVGEMTTVAGLYRRVTFLY